MLVTPAGTTLQTATQQQITGILPNVTYKVQATATSSLGLIVTYWSHIRGVDSL